MQSKELVELSKLRKKKKELKLTLKYVKKNIQVYEDFLSNNPERIRLATLVSQLERDLSFAKIDLKAERNK